MMNNHYDPQENGTGLAVPTLSSLAHSNSRAVRKAERRFDDVALAERTKINVAKEVVLNTCALSALADMAVQAVPSCERDVRPIVSSYASSSTKRIAETKWW